jgi:hypothetical protein
MLRPNRGFKRVVCIVGIIAVVPACNNRTEKSLPPPREGQSGGEIESGPEINWEKPFRDGPTFVSLAAVDEVLPFKVLKPAFGIPDLIQTIPPAALETPDQQQVALVYHLPDEGTVVLEESLPAEMTLEGLKQIAAAHTGETAEVGQATESATESSTPTMGPVPAFQIVPVRGTEGLLVQGNGVGRIMWVESGLLFDLTGPTISPDQVLALAEKI